MEQRDTNKIALLLALSRESCIYITIYIYYFIILERRNRANNYETAQTCIEFSERVCMHAYSSLCLIMCPVSKQLIVLFTTTTTNKLASNICNHHNHIHIYTYIHIHAAHQEALKREIERLRQVYHQQNLKKVENAAGSPLPSPSPKPICESQTEKEQLLNV